MNQVNKLAINSHKDEIIESVKNNQVTVITSGTGTGKSTQVPQILYNEGYTVAITQPRVIAAKMLAMRICNEMNVELGGIVGYSTGLDKSFSKETEILITTDGVQVLKELNAKQQSKEKVLIIDEVHEWNLNIEILIAYCRVILHDDSNIKIVLMSATLNTNKIIEFFGVSTSLIHVEEPSFEITDMESTHMLYRDIVCAMDRRENVLVFLPGKNEIYNMLRKLEERESDYVILPMHSELPYEQLQECLQPVATRKIILATNIAQTSLTDPDFDTVIDTGLERRIETVDGVTGLYLREISLADITQRRGRVGRVKPGNYILCEEHFVGFDRPRFPVPEIQRLGLERVCLTLLKLGFNPSKFEFFHQPGKPAIIHAIIMLQDLGCVDTNGSLKVTDIGEKVLSLPLSIRMGRILTEAISFGNTEEVLSCIAVHESGNLILAGSPMSVFETRSDMLHGYSYWKRLMMERRVNFQKLGVNKRVFFKVKDMINKIRPILMKNGEWSSNSSDALMLKAIIAGYADSPKTEYDLQLDKHSCVSRYGENILLGERKTIQYMDKWGDTGTFELLTNVISVDPRYMANTYPHLYTLKDGKEYFDYWSEKIYLKKELRFKGVHVTEFEEIVDDPVKLKRYIEKEENDRRIARENEERRLKAYEAECAEARRTYIQERNEYNSRNTSIVPRVYMFGYSFDVEDGNIIHLNKGQLDKLNAPVMYGDEELTIHCQGLESKDPNELRDKLREQTLIKAVTHINNMKSMTLETWVDKLQGIIKTYDDYILMNTNKTVGLVAKDRKIEIYQIDDQADFKQIWFELRVVYYLAKLQLDYPPAKFRQGESTALLLTKEERSRREFFFDMVKDEIVSSKSLSDETIFNKAEIIYEELVS